MTNEPDYIRHDQDGVPRFHFPGQFLVGLNNTVSSPALRHFAATMVMIYSGVAVSEPNLELLREKVAERLELWREFLTAGNRITTTWGKLTEADLPGLAIVTNAFDAVHTAAKATLVSAR